MNIDKLRDYDLTASIHTLAVKVPGFIVNPPEPIKRCIRVSSRQGKDGQIQTTLVINPNKALEGLTPDPDLYDFDSFNHALDKILMGLHIDNYKLIRCDMRLDSFDPDHYERFSKLNRVLIACLANAYKTSNNYRTLDLFSQQQLSIAIKNRYFEAENYDKQAESRGKDPACSRLELRSKSWDGQSIHKEFTQHWADRWAKALSAYALTQQVYNDELVRVFTEQSRTKKYRNISDFIIKNQGCIFCKSQMVDLILRTTNLSQEQAVIKARNLTKRYHFELFNPGDLAKAVNEIMRSIYAFFENEN